MKIKRTHNIKEGKGMIDVLGDVNESCKVNEAADVTDQVIIKLNEPGFIGKKHELQDKGYKVIGSGDGVIIMAKPKPLGKRADESKCKGKKCNEDLSYGELAAIEDEWNKWVREKGDASASSAWEFIESECADIYSPDECDDIFGYIGVLAESKCKGDKCESRERDIEIRKDRDKTRRLRREIAKDKRHLRDEDDYIKGDKIRNDNDIDENDVFDI